MANSRRRIRRARRRVLRFAGVGKRQTRRIMRGLRRGWRTNYWR